MAQVKLVIIVVLAALLALLAVAQAGVPVKYRRDEGHAVSDSSHSDSSDSSESSSSESREEHDHKQQLQQLQQLQPGRSVPVSNDQHEDQQQEEQYAGRPLDNSIPFEEKESDVLPPFPKPVRRNKGDVVEQKMEPGQPWESHYKHGVAPAKLPALETDNAHSYRHSIIHPYGDDLHA